MCSLVLNNWEQKYCQTLGNKPHHCNMWLLFYKGKIFNYLIICFTQCTLFPKVYFLLQICLPCITCRMYVTKINAVLWHRTQQIFAPLGLFRFACIVCLLQLWVKTSKLDYSIWASHASVYLTSIVGTWHHVHFGPVNNINNTCNN